MPTPEVTGSAALHSKEIKKIAKEYALKHSSAYVTASLIESMINGFTEQLSRDYCIVPKELIRKEYEKAKSTHDIYTSATCINEMESRAIDHAEGRMCVLTTLFGKSLFEEEK